MTTVIVESGSEPTVVAQTVDSSKLGSTSKKVVAGLSGSQALMGSLCLVFEMALLFMFWIRELGCRNFINGLIAPGIWNGFVLMAVGVFGEFTAKKNTRGFIIAHMIFNIVACLFMIVFMGLSGWAVSMSRSFIIQIQTQCNPTVVLVLNVLILLMAISQFIITIVAACLCCVPACCGYNQSSGTVHNTQYPMQAGYPFTVTTVTEGHQPPASYPYGYGQPQQMAVGPDGDPQPAQPCS